MDKAKLQWDDALALGNQSISSSELDELDALFDKKQDTKTNTPTEKELDAILNELDLSEPKASVTPVQAADNIKENQSKKQAENQNLNANQTPNIVQSKVKNTSEQTHSQPTKPAAKENVCPVCGKELTENNCSNCGFRKGKKTHLERVSGETKYLPPQKFVIDNPILCNENIARLVNGTYELIGYAPVKVKVVNLTDDEADLLQIDHALKTQNLSDEDKISAYKFEAERLDTIKSLFGLNSVAELNGISEKEMSKILNKLPPETQSILDEIMKESGLQSISEKAMEELMRLDNPTERDVFMILLKEMK